MSKFVENGKLPHLLFYGPPGTGKTTTALAMAKKMFGESGNSLASNVLEVTIAFFLKLDLFTRF